LAERSSGGNQSRSSDGGNRSKSGQGRSRSGGNRSNNQNKVNPADVARAAVQTVAQFTGRRPETVLGVQRDGDGWRVTVEVVEMSRIPASTDLLGSYVVSLDDEGEVVGYERRRRYQRGEVGGDQG
jgi:hypothetical protein